MSKTIKKVVIILGTLVVVAILWTFILGPNGVAKTVGASLAGRVDDIFEGIGLDTDLEGIYTNAFSGSGGTGVDDDVVY